MVKAASSVKYWVSITVELSGILEDGMLRRNAQ
jgi:hypothetical protein